MGTDAPRRDRVASALPTYVCMHMHSQASLHQRAHLPLVVKPDQDEGDKRATIGDLLNLGSMNGALHQSCDQGQAAVRRVYVAA